MRRKKTAVQHWFVFVLIIASVTATFLIRPSSPTGAAVLGACGNVAEDSTLSGNVTAGVSPCFDITANGVTLNCNGYAIVGVAGNTGVQALTRNGVKIVNCVFDYTAAAPGAISISFSTSSYSAVNTSNFTGGTYGIRMISGSEGNVFSSNRFDSLTYGISTDASSNGTIITNNTFLVSSANMINEILSANNSILYNNFTGNGASVVMTNFSTTTSNASIFFSNTMKNASVIIERSYNRTQLINITNNTLTNSRIILNHTANNTVNNNTITDVATALGAPIMLQNSSANNVTNNIILRSSPGIYLFDNSSNNNVSANTITNESVTSGGAAIKVIGSASNKITRNTLQNNTLGIWLDTFDSNKVWRGWDDGATIDANTIRLNRGPGIIGNYTTAAYSITNNIIMNNTGWAMWLNSTNANPNVLTNSMCWNSNTTFWSLGGTDFSGAAPQNNLFCVNVTTPNTTTRSSTFNWTISGNPVSWHATGLTNCTVSVDSVAVNWTQWRGVWDNVSIPLTGISDGAHNWSVSCDPYSNTAQSDTKVFTLDTTAPGWSVSANSAKCSAVNLSAYWQDVTTNISYAWLSTNETSAFVNYSGIYSSPISLNNASGWTNFSWWNESVNGKLIHWRVWVNDTLGNENGTSIGNFTAVPCANPAPLTGSMCSAPTLAVQWSGGAINLSTAYLSTNETSNFVNYTNYAGYNSPQSIGAGANWTNFTWWNSSMAGRKIAWRAYYNNTLGDMNLTDLSTFTATQCAQPSITTVSVCSNMTLAVQWTGGAVNSSMAYLSTNETGGFVNYTNYAAYNTPQNVSTGANWTNFTWWNSSVSGSVIGWRAYYNNTLGAINVTDLSTFTATPCAAASVVTASGSSSETKQLIKNKCSASSAVDTAKLTVQPMSAGETAMCTVSSGVVKSLSIKYATKVSDTSTFDVREVKDYSSSPPNTTIFKWLNLTTTVVKSALSSIKLQFGVSANWIADHDLTPSQILLWRWNGTSWESLPTLPLNSTSNETFFESTLTKFSTFAIAGSRSCPETCPSPSEWGTCKDTQQTRKTWSCSPEADFKCVERAESKLCDIMQLQEGQPRLLPFLPLNQVPPEQRIYVDWAIILVIVALAAGALFVWFRRRAATLEDDEEDFG